MSLLTFKELCAKWNLNPKCPSHIEDGWSHIVDSLLEVIVPIGFDVNDVLQIKEKFGRLCFYYDNSKEYSKPITSVISQAERFSTRNCEMCGNYGKLRKERKYIRTLCKDCNIKFPEK